MPDFDDTRLDDPQVLTAADDHLRHLASAGARMRRAAVAAEEVLADVGPEQPRAVLVVGPEARLLRAVLEPTCPVPFVAWPAPQLPSWVGALDLVVVLASGDEMRDEALHAPVHEAVRRGARLLVACPAESQLASCAKSTSTTVLPTTEVDELAVAVVMLQALAQIGVGPAVDPQLVAEALDMVAEDCSPFRDIATNPAKELALVLAEATPLIWGGSVLAARAGRRVAELLRAASGRAALAADSSELHTVIAGLAPHDPFRDPFEDPQEARPALVILDDGDETEQVAAQDRALEQIAADRHVRVWRAAQGRGSVVERYAALLHTGRYGAAYLALGLDTLS